MQLNPNRRVQVERMAEQLTAALLPPLKRKRGEQPDARLRQLEKDVQRGQVKCMLHVCEILTGRIDRGESVDSVTRITRRLDDLLRAYARQTPPPDVSALTVRMTKEIGDACGAAIQYAGHRCESSRRVLVQEASEARDVIEQVMDAAESQALKAVA
jgi:hypothetical protein